MPPSPAQHATILIVDDNPDIADAYAEQLRPQYSVRVAYNGEQAFDNLDDGVDVVLLDRKMPDLSGDDVLAHIRERGLSCRVAMVTAVDPDFDIIEMGFDDYVRKPISERELHETVERLLALETYDEQLQELFSEVSKCAILESEKNRTELETSKEYADLNSRVERLKDELDATRDELADEDLFRIALSAGDR